MNGEAITAGAATVWMAAWAPKGIVIRELLIAKQVTNVCANRL
jgi:hypothetical protein